MIRKKAIIDNLKLIRTSMFLITFFLASFLYIPPAVVQAACPPDCAPPPFDSIETNLDPDNPLGPACEETPEAAACQSDAGIDDDPVGDLIIVAVDALVIITATAAGFAIVYSAIRYIYSSGNDESIKAAKQTLTYAIVGIVVVVSVDQILNLVFSL